MKYRNKTDIIAQMLESASGESLTKTKIMYKAYVPHEQITYHLQLLVDNVAYYILKEKHGITKLQQKASNFWIGIIIYMSVLLMQCKTYFIFR